MSISRKLMTAGGDATKYVDELFATYLYSGDGTASRNIVNGIDLADKGGLVWTKCRSTTFGHVLHDSEMAPESFLSSDGSAPLYGPASAGADTVLSLNSDGYSLGNSQFVNQLSTTYASWTFAKQEGFFDIVTYTGDGISGRTIPHSLGSTPGMVIIKSTTSSASWLVWHKDLLNFEYYLNLDTTAAQSNANKGFTALPTENNLSLNAFVGVNQAGVDYVAYVFANDAPMFGPNGDESIIKCGTLDVNNYNVEEDLGWEPQWILIKQTNGTGDWKIIDNMRGSADPQPFLYPNNNAVETVTTAEVEFTSRGFVQSSLTGANQGIYMAIRRPNKPASEFAPDELFAAEYGNNGVAPTWSCDFPMDMQWYYANGNYIHNKLMGSFEMRTENDSVQSSVPNADFYQDGFGSWTNNYTAIPAYMFRRAPSFLDVVKYTGDGAASRQVPHNLGATPQMVWCKAIDARYDWSVYSEEEGPGRYIVLNTNQAANTLSTIFPLVPTGDDLELGSNATVNANGQDYIAYLWASSPGICDIGSYTGTEADLNIECGFTNGARFVLIRRTDASDAWKYYDTLRGISASSSPQLLLSSISSTSGSFIKPYAGGFVVADNSINALGGTYIYMAIA